MYQRIVVIPEKARTETPIFCNRGGFGYTRWRKKEKEIYFVRCMEHLQLWHMLFALGQVILIDLVMSGDNALMISVTTQWLKKHDRKKAILFGVIGAALMRVIFAFGLAQMLDFPVVKMVGAGLLFVVAIKLYRQFRENEENTKEHKAGTSRWHALGMIIVADVSMSLDNILAVASAAGEHPIALTVGIVVSLVLMSTVATWISKLLERYPQIEWLWFAVIVFLAFKMLFASINDLVSIDYHAVLYRSIGMVGTFGMIYLHRKYMSVFEEQEVTRLLYTHAPFIVTVLLLLVTAFLVFGDRLHDRLHMHQPVWFTLCTCVFLLALEMASIERVKHKVKISS